MTNKLLCNSVGIALGFGLSLVQDAAGLTPKQAQQYFQEADALVRADHGQLWGVSLGGGLLLVDPASRVAFANQRDPEGWLQQVGSVWRGEISTEVNLANTALDWAGAKWSMILLPLPEDRVDRARLNVHELWHGAQQRLGLPSTAATNDHLETRDGRYWLQLEWRALSAALAAKGAERAEAMTNAILFRTQRRTLFPAAAAEENTMEMHEGLAEYTGVKLSGATDPERYVIENELRAASAKETFVRSFAYATGPAYGLLLDRTGADWRKGLRPSSDLSQLLLRAAHLTLPADLPAAANRRANAYDAAKLAAEENARAKKQQAVLADYRARLVDGPVLKLPLRDIQMAFDPGNLLPMDSLGTVYPHLRIVDDWGILTVEKRGALLTADFSTASVARPSKFKNLWAAGEGWTLQLKPGWKLVPGPRPGDYQLRPTAKPSPETRP